MTQSTSPAEAIVSSTSNSDSDQTVELDIEQLKTKIKKLNSKAGQLKMDLHDLAEGLPNDYDQLMVVAERTYTVFCTLAELKQQLKTLEAQGSK